jgi:hypothetical protein
LAADCGGHGGFVAGVDFETFGDAVLRYFDAVGVIGSEGAIFEGGVKEIDNSERKALLGGCCRLRFLLDLHEV